MSEQTGPKTLEVTKVRFQENKPAYVSATAYTALKHLASSIPRAKVTLREFSVQYELPPNQIVRPLYDNARYFIEVDIEAIVSNCIITTEKKTETIALLPPPIANSTWALHQLTITQETRETTPLLIKEDAKFTDVTLYLADTTVEISSDAFFVFREIYKGPTTVGVLNQAEMGKLYFTNEPVYEVELYIEGWTVDTTGILNTIATFLPLLADTLPRPIETSTCTEPRPLETGV